ncbi:signal peptidase II [Akkermansia glycaniphila]|uniref:Lipoprotein signal peptidase n=1 Tax=Akkermansia glycaniphila TaxID=1679444 RepID=A0A1C7PA96_9BACT|nr:signal peptidase II [Akkermansia glycaniphila]OCA02481.1 hypothetical protein AC781_09730 [Akkermansia glycaniphila]SEH90196.1 signal peptidase (spase) ii [Akkermansia glycaniphila]
MSDQQSPEMQDLQKKGGRQSLTKGLVILVAVLYLLDQATKWWIVFDFKEPLSTPVGLVIEQVPVVQDFFGLFTFNIIRVHNTGVAFGMGNGTAWSSYVFLMIPVVALIGLFWLFRRGFFETKLLRLAWAFITAGILGNLTDRLTQGFFLAGSEHLSFLQNLMNGYVVDFLDVSFPWIKGESWPSGYHWPAFNVADACICTAAGLFLIGSLILDARKKREKEEAVRLPEEP